MRGLLTYVQVQPLTSSPRYGGDSCRHWRQLVVKYSLESLFVLVFPFVESAMFVGLKMAYFKFELHQGGGIKSVAGTY